MALSNELKYKLAELRDRHQEISNRLSELKMRNRLLKQRQEELFLKFVYNK